jgi:hypothetical protein
MVMIVVYINRLELLPPVTVWRDGDLQGYHPEPRQIKRLLSYCQENFLDIGFGCGFTGFQVPADFDLEVVMGDPVEVLNEQPVPSFV